MRRLMGIWLAGFMLLASTSKAYPFGDKALHGLAGASFCLLASAALSPLLLSEMRGREALELALAVSASGLGAALVAGMVKELLDLSGTGRPEWLDLAATVAGGLAASVGVFAITYLAASQGTGVERLPQAYAPFGVVLAIPVGEALVRRLFGRPGGVSTRL